MPTSGIRSAINYSLNRWTALNDFTRDGKPADQQKLPVRAVFQGDRHGTQDWLFVGNEAATLYSLVMTCRRLDLDPY